MSRIEKIQSMLLLEPHDTFLRYTLAMEHRKLGNVEEALELFQNLAYENTPKYVPAFFMAAQVLVGEDRIEDARTYLRDGIEEARSQKDLHAAAEMSELLAEIGK